MEMRLYNTLSRKIEKVVPLEDNKIRIYTCGPTVYDYAHIGNLRTFVFNDLLKRTLRFLGFEVFQVINITDVDDKTIAASQKQGVSLKEYTAKYEKLFFEDLRKLNILLPEKTPRATEHIKEMILLIKTLLEKGFAYKGEDGSIYFDISKFKNYGRLSRINLKGLKPGARVAVDEYGKEQVSDFALWKAYSPEDGEVFWDSPFGKGRPGWHIECSAMGTKYLGESFEIHTGAVDLVFPHHENEIAQTEAATGSPWVKYWIHGEHLLVDGKKMSKSLGNIYKLDDILEKGFSPLALRYLFLTAHYRQILNFTWEALRGAQNALERLYETVIGLKEKNQNQLAKELNEKWQKRFAEALSSDLNMPQALAIVWEMLKDKLPAEQKLALLYDWDRVLGLDLEKPPRPPKPPKEIKELLEEREKLRKERKFARADEVRKEIEGKGWLVEDTSQGPRLKKA